MQAPREIAQTQNVALGAFDFNAPEAQGWLTQRFIVAKVCKPDEGTCMRLPGASANLPTCQRAKHANPPELRPIEFFPVRAHFFAES